MAGLRNQSAHEEHRGVAGSNAGGNDPRFRRLFGGALVWMALGALFVGGSACNFLIRSDSNQCTVDADCKALGPDFANTVCNSRSVCVLPQGYCASNKECIDRFPADDPHLCQANQCVRLKSEDCNVVLGTPEELSNDANVVIGLEAALTGPNGTAGTGGLDAVILARNNLINTQKGGLPPAVDNGPARPLIVVACDEATNAVRAATHLVKDLHIQAIVGPQLSPNAIAVIQQVTVPNQVITVTANTSTYAITLLDRHDFVWRMNAVDKWYVQGYATLLPLLEQDLQTRGLVTKDATPTSPSPLKVASFHNGGVQGTSVQPLFLDQAKFNGGVKASDQVGTTYKDIPYWDGKDPAQQKPVNDAAVQSVIDFLPHVVMVFGLGEAIANVTAIESKWPPGAPYKPYYIMHSSAFTTPWAQYTATNDDFRKRIFGATAQSSTAPGTVNDTVHQAWTQAYGNDKSAVWGDGAVTFYDGFNVLMYGIMALGNKPVTSTNLIGGLQHFDNNSQLILGNLDPSQILTAIPELVSGRNIHYRGVLGDVTFDNQREFAPGPTAIWCVNGPGATPANVATVAYSLKDRAAPKLTKASDGSDATFSSTAFPCAP